MTNKQSEFGSLSDRTNAPQREPIVERATPASTTVRHAWLDGDIPVLLTRWRQTQPECWEGLIIGASLHGPATAWVSASRLRPADIAT